MLTLRVALCCCVLWVLSSGCASSSASERKNDPASETGGPAPASAVQAAEAQVEKSAQKPSGYGYTPEDPIKVGGGPRGEHEYLQWLRGPEGQRLRYVRRGSC